MVKILLVKEKMTISAQFQYKNTQYFEHHKSIQVRRWGRAPNEFLLILFMVGLTQKIVI